MAHLDKLYNIVYSYRQVFNMDSSSGENVSLLSDMWDIEAAILYNFAARCCSDGSIEYASRLVEDLQKQGGLDGYVPVEYFLKISGSYLRRITLKEMFCNAGGAFEYWREFAVLMENLVHSVCDMLRNDKILMMQLAKQMYPNAQWSDDYHPPWEE